MKLKIAFRNFANAPKMYIDLHVQYSLFLPDFNETWIFSPDFRKYWSESSSSGSQFIPRGQTDGQMDRQTDMGETNSRFHIREKCLKRFETETIDACFKKQWK